jgi:hypothetical protein
VIKPNLFKMELGLEISAQFSNERAKSDMEQRCAISSKLKDFTADLRDQPINLKSRFS